MLSEKYVHTGWERGEVESGGLLISVLTCDVRWLFKLKFAGFYIAVFFSVLLSQVENGHGFI